MVESSIAHSPLAPAVNDLYTYLKSKALIRIKKADIQRKLPVLDHYIDSVRLVKTLWQVDKPVDVESFYCDSHVLLQTRGKKPRRKKVNYVSDLNSKDNFVIQGIAGQGKSILLRHLFINQASLGTHIPIFIELRRIQTNEKLLTHISRFLQMLDLPADPTIVEILLRSGKFMFFLDGFDEIAYNQVMSIINELEYLTSISRGCRFIITSRLDSPITMSPHFNVVSLDDLRRDEYQKLIRKLSDDRKYARAIVTAIKARQPSISQLLCTPLLVTLLLIAYKSYRTIPVQLSGFYEFIFINLLQRHDGTKPAFTRARRCSLNDNQYRQVFDAFCFESKKLNTKAFDYQQIYSLVNQAMSSLGIDEDVDAYIKDIKSITCLLLEESGQYRFIHGTVQDYYSASFVKNLPEPSAIRFYRACLDSPRFRFWLQELEFLSDIDPYRHTRYFLVPVGSRAMGYEHDVHPTFLHPARISLDRTKNIFETWILTLTRHNGKTRCSSIETRFTPTRYLLTQHRYPDVIHKVFSYDYTQLMDAIISGKTVINTRDQPSINIAQRSGTTPSRREPSRVPQVSITIKQILDEGFLTSEFKSAAQVLSLNACTRWHQAIAYLNRQDLFAETLEI